MQKQFPENQEPAVGSLEALEVATNTLASEFHEDWRKTRLQEDGSFEPRIKSTTDTDWIESHGTDQVDIANTTYDDLPTDWQAENRAAAEVVVDIMVNYNGTIDLNNEDTRNQVGDTIHKAWLARNDWAKDGELGKNFADLPIEEQAKDITQVEVAQKIFAKK